MDLYEHQGKELFAKHGIPVPRGIVAESPEAARSAAEALGGSAVVKVQVQAGGRGKGGGVVLVDSPREAEVAAERMLREGFQGRRVNRVLVEERLPIARELYAAILLDRSTGTDLAMVSLEGGVDIEELARERPEAIRRQHIDPEIGIHPYHLRRLTGALPNELRDLVGNVVAGLYDVLTAEDATLVEVNPLVVLTDGRVLALDAKVTIDDNALYRHPEIEMLRSAFPIDPVEFRAREAGLQYVKLDGRVGIIGNGAGLVMSTLDLVHQAGAGAANFLDVGGGASADAIATSLEVVLSDPAVRSVLVNIFGGITRCDVVARGLLEALERVQPTVRIVVRLDGTNAEEGRRILREADHPMIVPAETMLEAARVAAELANAEAA
ncbi:MAG: succinate--CoA ligase [ADP-forming] subunit beta 2 [Actinomycetota bacterium]|nr:MAG: succinate--CoA ligase [ADP-forming] subunit beta 2 [Actinomycetota bacterium]